MVEWTPEKVAEANRKTFHLRLDPDDLKALQHEAVEQDRMVSDILRDLITEYLRGRR